MNLKEEKDVSLLTDSKPPLAYGKLFFLTAVHLAAVVAVVMWLVAPTQMVSCTWPSVTLTILWFLLSSIAITAGYHRLFSHPTYIATTPLKIFYLLCGLAGVQGSALQWAAQHRDHHTYVDGPGDPYNIQLGFWFAHIGWVVRVTYPNYRRVPDLARDRLLLMQHRLEIPLTVFLFVLPAGLGAIWGEAVGAFLLVSFVRLVIQWHMTFFVNSIAHFWGKQKYSTKNSSRGSWLVSLLTFGEAQDHNYHHAHPEDFRTGTNWWDFDPAKWFINCCVALRLASHRNRGQVTS